MSNTTRRHPRTLQEAFGPYTGRDVQPMPEPSRWTDRAASIALAVVIAAAIVGCTLADMGAL